MAGRNTKQNKGFTLNEMLIVVAVFAILAAVSIPLVIAAKKNLKYTELCDTAREIYISVQNKLVGEKATGQLISLENIASGDSAHKLTAAPQDFDTVDEADRGLLDDLFYLDSGEETSAMYSYLIDETSLEDDLLDGHFIVEFNPRTADVYGVFYAESGFQYSDITALSDRAASTLKNHKPMIGYYGGGIDASNTSDLPSEFHVDASVVNGEELYLDFTCDNLIKLVKSQSSFSITITLTDETTKASAEKVLTGGTSEFSILKDKMEFKILLDSMQEEYHFQDILKSNFKPIGDGGYPTPGDNLKISIKAQFKKDDVYIENKEGTQLEVNSLFKGRTDDGGGKASIEIGCLRHLNNLRSDYFTPAQLTALSISQVQNVDFLAGQYAWSGNEYVGNAASPVNEFTPVLNTALDGITTYNGGNNQLRNFKVAKTDNAGIFGSLNGWTLDGLQIIDPEVSGTGSAGALAGKAESCKISGCGVYLSTSDDSSMYFYQAADSDAYQNRMEQRRAQYTVAADGTAGGLLGTASKTSVTDSFAAIDVSGGTAGGLAGSVSGGEISGCYSSGNVTASGTAGGLIGTAGGAAVAGCYSTSNVVAPAAGGITGSGTSQYTDCIAYGRVCSKADGTVDAGTSGGLTGTSGQGSTFTNCAYLKQKEYNEGYTDPSGVTAKMYSALALAKDAKMIPGDPYDVGLYAKSKGVFPFPSLEKETMHHGDWPLESTIQVALVYYERYKSGAYGFYAITSLSSGDSSLISKDDGTRWMVDTLNDSAICVEDGYALMSVYQISRFSYQLNDGNETEALVSKTATQGNSLSLGTKRSLTFQKCEITDSNSGEAKVVTGSGAATFTADALYLYRLPFALQETDRNAKAAYYDKLELTAAYDTEGSVSPILSKYWFYYNPHFAGNAINPDPLGNNTPAAPKDPTEIRIRSPRQLHNIAYYSYYWNKSNNLLATDKGKAFTFNQETDLNFSAYTKSYCGVKFDLMDTSQTNLYRNLPIGRPSQQKFTYRNQNGEEISLWPSSFQNVYDGHCHKIIDFCCKTYLEDNFQFTGLFGEVQSATLKNIVMEASQPGSNSGYIVSYYDGVYDKSLTGTINKDRGVKNAGVGALAGLIYRGNSSGTTVTNCAVTGYVVSYYGTMQSAVGGLLGYNMGSVENCAAVCKSVYSKSHLTTRYANKVGRTRTDIGGLVGVNMAAIKNCYAGGNLVIDPDGKYSAGSIGGIAGEVHSLYKQGGKLTASIQNCYSYCTPSMNDIYYINYYGISQLYSYNGDPYCTEQSISGCYYLKNTWESGPTEYGNKKYDGKSTGKYYMDLCNLSLSGFGKAAYSYPWSAQSGAYPFPAVVKNSSGSLVHYGNWPTNVVASGVLVYYEEYEDDYGYYFIDPDGSGAQAGQVTVNTLRNDPVLASGYGYLAASIFNNSITITIGEKTYFVAFDKAVDSTGVNILQKAISSDGRNMIDINLEFTRLYPFDSEILAAMKPDNAMQPVSPTVRIEVNAKGISGNVGLFWRNSYAVSDNYYPQEAYVNSGFAAAIDTQEDSLGIVNAFQLRRPGDFEEISSLAELLPDAYLSFTQTRDIAADGDTGLVNTAPYFTVSGNEDRDYWVISNLQNSLFDKNLGTVSGLILNAANCSDAAMARENDGTISDCLVSESVVSTGDAAGFVQYNEGYIENCAYQGSVDGENAAGFVLQNDGTIRKCAAKIDQVTGGESAAGFALWSQSGTIESCSASDGYVVSANGTAYGFCAEGGRIDRCSANVRLSGETTVGFAGSGTIQNSYTVSDAVTGFTETGTCSYCYACNGAAVFGGSSGNTECYQFSGIDYDYDYGPYGIPYEAPADDTSAETPTPEEPQPVYFDDLLHSHGWDSSIWTISGSYPYLMLQ